MTLLNYPLFRLILRARAYLIIAAVALAMGASVRLSAASFAGEILSSPPTFRATAIGKGPNILFIPGLSSSSETWDATVRHLQAHHRCIVINLAGFAGAPAVSLEGPLMPRVRDDLARFIRDNHLDHPAVVGHSLGGTIAMDLAIHEPKLVGPVVIVDSLPFLAGAWFRVDDANTARGIAEQLKAQMDAQTEDQWVAHQRSGESTNEMTIDRKNQETLIRWGVASDRKTVTRALTELLETDLRADLAAVQSPMLVIGTWAGQQKMGASRDSVEQLFKNQYANAKDVRIVIAPTAHHFVMWDEPDWFYAQLDSFLAEHPAPKGKWAH